MLLALAMPGYRTHPAAVARDFTSKGNTCHAAEDHRVLGAGRADDLVGVAEALEREEHAPLHEAVEAVEHVGAVLAAVVERHVELEAEVAVLAPRLLRRRSAAVDDVEATARLLAVRIVDEVVAHAGLEVVRAGHAPHDRAPQEE